MKMKRFFILSLMALMTISSTADTLTIRQPFIEMPDSLIPYLSHNSRLDFLDFMDSKMKAEIIAGLEVEDITISRYQCLKTQ